MCNIRVSTSTIYVTYVFNMLNIYAHLYTYVGRIYIYVCYMFSISV